MNKLLVLLSSFCASFAYGDTHLHLGDKEEFGSDSQIAALKKTIKQDADGKFIALTWNLKLPSGTKAETLLFYDREAQHLWRAKSLQTNPGRLETTWVSWNSVTDSNLQSQKETEGFELPGFKTGRGALPLSNSARSFLSKSSKAKWSE